MASCKELSELYEAAISGILLGNKDLSHLSNKVGIKNYIKIADEIKKIIKKGKILDWGCGYGHMTYLLRNRDIESMPYEVEKRDNLEKFQIFSKLNIIFGDNEHRLPFETGFFDGVLSCGTLEHVSDINSSLIEVSRILKKDGFFFIYMLPNKRSYAEWIAEKRGKSIHPVKYNIKEISKILGNFGYKIITIRRSNLLPKNLTDLPFIIKKIYGSLSFLIIPIDSLLSKIPLLNQFCGVFEIVA